MRSLIFLYIIEEVAHTHVCAEHTSWAVLVDTWARSRVQAVERDMLVAYPVIDIRDRTKDPSINFLSQIIDHGMTYSMINNHVSSLMGEMSLPHHERIFPHHLNTE